MAYILQAILCNTNWLEKDICKMEKILPRIYKTNATHKHLTMEHIHLQKHICQIQEVFYSI